MTKVNVILAEMGKQNPNLMGTLDLLNAGIANLPLLPVGPGQLVTPSMALALFLEVDYALVGRAVGVEIKLVNADGQLVEFPGPAGLQPMIVRQTVRPKATLARVGTPARCNLLAIIQPGLPLEPDTSYTWKVKVGEEAEDNWSASFYVQPIDGGPVFGHEASAT